MTRTLPGVDDFYPLAPLQQGMLYHTLVAPRADAYCQQASFGVDGSVDAAAFEQAWRRVTAVHPILRTSFVWKGLSKPAQVVHREVPFALRVEDWRDRASSLRTDFEALLAAERRAGFDLARAPLMRVVLVREPAGRHRVVWTYHHIMLDGWSANRVLDQVLDAYERLSAGLDSAVPMPRPYRDYIAWLERQDRPAAERYWRRVLSDHGSPTPLAVDHEAADVDPSADSVATETLSLSMDTSERLAQTARAARVTLNTLVQGAFGLVLGRYSGRSDVVFGATVSGRPADLDGADDMVGVFINTLPVRMQLPDGDRLALWLSRLQNEQAEARLYDYASLVDIHGLSGVPRDQSLFDAILVFANYGGSTPWDRRRRALPVRDYRTWESSNYALNAFVDVGASVTLGAVHDRRRLDGDTTRRFLEHWAAVLDQMTTQPACRLADLTPVVGDERHRLLGLWNDTDREFPRDLCLQRMVRRMGFGNRAAVAVAAPDGELTYGELDRRAGALAGHLVGLGLGRGDHVGVFMRRCPDVVVALLGVLDAGAAFAPLDPDWPAERIGRILVSLDIRCVLADRTQTRRLHDACQELASVPDVVYLDVETPGRPVEALDRGSVTGFWDHLAQTATDRVSAAGFRSAVSGRPFSEEEVDGYVDRVVELASRDVRPDSRVLEIGCGSGLIVLALAPVVGAYWGLDPSAEAQARNRQAVDRAGLDHVRLLTGFLDEVEDLEPHSMDLVILASTVQFFPGPGYLDWVLDRALRLLRPGGAVLLCDLIDPAVREATLAAATASADRSQGTTSTSGQLEAGLAVGEPYLRAFVEGRSDVAGLTVHRRERGFDNELRFRYDVVLRTHPDPARSNGTDPPIDCGEGTGVTRTRQRVWTRWDLDRLQAVPPPATVQPDDVAYVIHTSGSTGVPKGVIVRHRPVVNLIDWVNRTFDVRSTDRLLWTASICFDLSIYDVFGLLAAGGTIRIADDAELRDPAGLARTLAREPITFWDSAPASLQRLVPFLSAAAAGVSSLALRLVFLSGDWIPVTLPDEVRHVFRGARVIALGGATEATVWSNFYPVDRVDPRWPSIPYGRPIQNARYYVLDERMDPVPVGVSGELYIAGQCLSSGYWADAVLTAGKYVPDPFTGEAGAQMYRTGDRVRFLEDGNIQFMGRVDRQMKIRGHRIEPGEVESALVAHPAVKDAVVMATERAPGDWRLVAYLTARDGQQPDETALRRHLGSVLPAYMIPSAYVVLEAIPVTVNGKIDRAALPDPGGRTEAGTDRYVAPATELERTVAMLWCDVLGVDRVGRDDNFFDLGGHSLLLIQLHGKLQKAIRDDIGIVDLFRYPTVAALAGHLASDVPDTKVSYARREELRRDAARRALRLVARRGPPAKSQ